MIYLPIDTKAVIGMFYHTRYHTMVIRMILFTYDILANDFYIFSSSSTV